MNNMEQPIEIMPSDVFVLKGELLIPILQYLSSKPSKETGFMFLSLDNELATQKRNQINNKEIVATT